MSATFAQGYLAKTDLATIRVRVSENTAWITVKGQPEGHGRLEFEYSIPLSEGTEMLTQLSKSALSKVRHFLSREPRAWTVDVFLGDSEGLVLLEVEDSQPILEIELPTWVGREVTGDPRYYNEYLSEHPYQTWADDDIG